MYYFGLSHSRESEVVYILFEVLGMQKVAWLLVNNIFQVFFHQKSQHSSQIKHMVSAQQILVGDNTDDACLVSHQKHFQAEF